MTENLFPEQTGNSVVWGATGAGKTRVQTEIMTSFLQGADAKPAHFAGRLDKPRHSQGETNNEP